MNLDLHEAEQLIETAEWCNRVFYEPPFAATEQLMPIGFRGRSISERLHFIQNSSLAEVIGEVASNRRSALEHVPTPLFSKVLEDSRLPSLRTHLFTGRVYKVRLSSTPRKTHLVEANETSRGFFDASGLPIWDSWSFTVVDEAGDHLLFGWVPNEITQYVGAGMCSFAKNFAQWVEVSE